MDGYQWTVPFAIDSELMTPVCLWNEARTERKDILVEVRGGTKTSQYEVILRPFFSSSRCRLKMRMQGIQIDDQLHSTPKPVLFRPQRVGDDSGYMLELSITQDYSGSLDLCIYPDIDLQVPHSTAFLVRIHEPIIWRLNELIQKVDISNILGSSDPIIQIGALTASPHDPYHFAPNNKISNLISCMRDRRVNAEKYPCADIFSPVSFLFISIVIDTSNFYTNI